MKRKPTFAMYEADCKRIAKAQAKKDTAFNAVMVNCPSDMGCGTWIREHAASDLRDAYLAADNALIAEEQSAISRGTMYRATFGMLTRVIW